MTAQVRIPSQMRSIGLRSEHNTLCADLKNLLTVSGRLEGEFSRHVEVLTEVLQERDLLYTLIDQVPDQLFIKDRSLRFLVANDAVIADKAFLDGTPMSTQALIGRTDFDLFPPEIAQRFANTELEILRVGEPVTTDMRENIGNQGWSRWVSMTKAPVRNQDGEIIGLLGVGRDVTARKQAEERVQFLAHHDFLTGLPNRALFLDRLTQAIADSTRHETRLALVFCDIDRFKMVNDTWGHKAGDMLLTVVANRLNERLTSSDTVARLGGDEFVILCDIGHDGTGVVDLVSKIRMDLSHPIDLMGHDLCITASMGVATFPESGRTAEELLVAADAAMYRAKECGRDNVQY